MAKRTALAMVRSADLCAALLALDQAEAFAECPELYGREDVRLNCKASAAALRAHYRAVGPHGVGDVVRVERLGGLVEE